MVSPRRLSSSTTRTVPSTEGPSSSDVMRSATDPRWSGFARTKSAAAVTKAATEVFMSAAPRPKSFSSRIVGMNGSERHFSRGPVGTTSVWPARTTTGFVSPCRIQRLVTSPKTITSGRKPRGARRSTMSCWQPSSAGVTDLRAMSAFASSRVSFFKRWGSGIGRLGGRMDAAGDHGTHALLDAPAQLPFRAQREEGFRAHEKRADEKLAQVVEEGGLHAFVAMAQELERPSHDEEDERGAERCARAHPGERLARDGARAEERDRHGDAEGRVEPQVVGAHRDREEGGERHIDGAGGD